MAAVVICLVAIWILVLLVFRHTAIPVALWLTSFVLAWLAWLAFGRRGYKRRYLEASPGADWHETAERFVDSRTGETVAVYWHPATGERAYVRERP